MIVADKASAEQLITVRMVEKLNNFMTDNARDNCYPHIRLLPTRPHLAFADFIWRQLYGCLCTKSDG